MTDQDEHQHQQDAEAEAETRSMPRSPSSPNVTMRLEMPVISSSRVRKFSSCGSFASDLDLSGRGAADVLNVASTEESQDADRDHSVDQSLGNGVSSDTGINSDDDENDASFLALCDDNERLRNEVSRLKVHIALLQSKLKKQRFTGSSAQLTHDQTTNRYAHSPLSKFASSPARTASPLPPPPVPQRTTVSILIDLPASLRQAAARFTAYRRETSVTNKSHQSFPTDDDVDTLEPEVDIEMFESANGLHHRSNSHPNPQPRMPVALPKGNATTLSQHPLKQESFPDDNGDDSDNMSMGASEFAGLIKPADADTTLTTANDIRRTQSRSDDPSAGDSSYGDVQERAGWLVGLLVLQSMSSFIIARNESMLKRHAVIVQFLTMLVGAGGNAGNQASVRVIRGLAIGTVHDGNARTFLGKELIMGISLSCLLAVAGFIRATVFNVPLLETTAITSSLFMIVFMSVAIGATLPLAMKFVGIDPAHSSTTIQVIMDILGVTITVISCRVVLGSQFEPLDAALNSTLVACVDG